MSRVKVKGIRKGKWCVFNEKIRPYTLEGIKPGERAMVKDNSHDLFVIVVPDRTKEVMAVPRPALSPLGPLDQIVEAMP